MSMEINGRYEYLKAGYEEKVKENGGIQKAQKEAGAEDIKAAAKQDAYISSGKSEKKPAGLYRVGQDESGRRKIFYDDPKRTANAENKSQAKADDKGGGKAEGSGQPKAGGKNPGKPAEKCVSNTDKVDREIKKLKEKKQELEQQIQSAAGDEKKVRKLEKKLAQVENELMQKDNDTYRRAHTSVTQQQ